MTFEEIVQAEARKAKKQGIEEGMQQLLGQQLEEGTISMEYAVAHGYKQEVATEAGTGE